MEKYYTLEESLDYKGKFLLKPNHDLLPFKTPIKGSYQFLAAKFLNFSYVNYLKFSRDILKATLIRKNGFAIPYFERNKETMAFLRFLNKRIELALYIKNHPYEIRKNEDGELIKEFYS